MCCAVLFCLSWPKANYDEPADQVQGLLGPRLGGSWGRESVRTAICFEDRGFGAGGLGPVPTRTHGTTELIRSSH